MRANIVGQQGSEQDDEDNLDEAVFLVLVGAADLPYDRADVLAFFAIAVQLLFERGDIPRCLGRACLGFIGHDGLL